MTFYGWMKEIRRFSPSLVALPLLVLLSGAVAQVHSGGATLLLRATLSQSLTMSAMPQMPVFSAFVSSPATTKPDLAVTFRINWVRGPGRVSVVVVPPDATEGTRSLEAGDTSTGGVTELRMESGNLQLPSHPDGVVLTIRAQAI